ncbi:hypothetical protein GCM10010466_25880 [Planomonospora alba]|uniref:UDP-glucose 4-epimerase n=1 Tax=Planomonospora alba TaxID=161354 RepID=A0ABP6N4S7_9ACTN
MARSAESGNPPGVGTSPADYPIRGGSGIRDYIHVWDLAAAHVAALRAFDEVLSGQRRRHVINLGTGTGTTVTEPAGAFNAVVDPPVAVAEAPRRPDDVVGACARSDRAVRLLGRKARYSITDWAGAPRLRR